MSAADRPRVVVGVLGMPDNEATARLLAHLSGDPACHIDFVVYWHPSPRDQLRRLVRKVRAEGVLPAAQRVRYALRRAPRRSVGAREPERGDAPPWREHHVPSHNSPECRRVLEQEGVDVLVLSTDSIIGSGILSVPRVMTVNAHPGWIPRYRGLGSNLFQMEHGHLPAVSVHAVDEGIDTGPLIVREKVPVDPTAGLADIEEAVERRRLELLADVLGRAERGELRYVDTFCEPSNMTRGMPSRRRRRLDARLRSGQLELS
jgi:folate-dependent phosphoribosylglycinamide formyltransferase PurN